MKPKVNASIAVVLIILGFALGMDAQAADSSTSASEIESSTGQSYLEGWNADSYNWELGKNWDYGLSAGARSYPFGAGVGGRIGYSGLLWGAADKNSILYGYYRPSLAVMSSGSVNRGNAKIEMSPIAPVVFSVGAQLLTMNSDLDTVDCKAVSCSHYISKQMSSVALVGGSGPWFLKLEVGVENQTASVKDLPFADPDSTLVAAVGRDRLLSQELTTGIVINDRWTTGIQAGRNEFAESGTKNDVQSAFVKNKLKDYSWLGGAGTYESNFARKQVFGYLSIEWTYGKSLSLM